jgi:hypothetical protein
VDASHRIALVLHARVNLRSRTGPQVVSVSVSASSFIIYPPR